MGESRETSVSKHAKTLLPLFCTSAIESKRMDCGVDKGRYVNKGIVLYLVQ